MEILLIIIGLISYSSLLLTAFILKHLGVSDNNTNPVFTSEEKTIDRHVKKYIRYMNTEEINKDLKIVSRKISKEDLKNEINTAVSHNINLRAENAIEPVWEVLNSMIRLSDDLCLSEADNIIIILGSGRLYFGLQLKENNSGKSIILDLNKYKANEKAKENELLGYTCCVSAIIFIASFVYIFIL